MKCEKINIYILLMIFLHFLEPKVVQYLQLDRKSDNDKNMTQVILKSAKFFAEEKQTFPDGTTIKMNEVFFSESEAQVN